ncbi:hypothetical protein ACEPAH_1955 [Sanghuangporus vaninii]
MPAAARASAMEVATSVIPSFVNDIGPSSSPSLSSLITGGIGSLGSVKDREWAMMGVGGVVVDVDTWGRGWLGIVGVIVPNKDVVGLGANR